MTNIDLMIVPTRWGGYRRKYLSSDMTDPIELELYKRVIRAPLTKQH